MKKHMGTVLGALVIALTGLIGLVVPYKVFQVQEERLLWNVKEIPFENVETEDAVECVDLKEEYGKIMLDLTAERLNTDVLFCHAVMISPSSYGLKVRIKNVLSKQRNKKRQILMGILVVLFCIGTCFYEIPFLHNMNQEETIRQYVFYCNQEYFMGLQKICVPEKMDYFFHPKVTGKIVSLNKTSENSEEVLYQVVTEDKKGCKKKQSICLVQREQWKVKPWSEANVPFQYDVVKNKIRVKAYIGKEDVVSVPEKIEGKTVNEIRSGAFKNCNVKKITIPASVETIGSMAFFNLPDCEEITIGNKMALKSDDIFKRCPKLKEVNTKGKVISDSRCNSYPATSRL